MCRALWIAFLGAGLCAGRVFLVQEWRRARRGGLVRRTPAAVLNVVRLHAHRVGLGDPASPLTARRVQAP
jgi:hypothetical protein